MPVLDGINTTARLTIEPLEVAIVILTSYSDDASVLAALRAGARSYLTKDVDRIDIARALHFAARGLSVLDPAVHATLLAAATHQHLQPRTTPTQLPDGLPMEPTLSRAQTGPTHHRYGSSPSPAGTIG
jgi:DNA-binding NarL/FixJ family response regulator